MDTFMAFILMDTHMNIMGVGVGILGAVPYIVLCFKSKHKHIHTPDIIAFFGIILSTYGVFASTRMGLITVLFGLEDPSNLGVFQGNGVFIIAVGILSMIWLSVKGVAHVYRPILNNK